MEEQKNEEAQIASGRNGRMKLWIKRVGFAGFLLFLIKGLVWIGVFVFLSKGCET